MDKPVHGPRKRPHLIDDPFFHLYRPGTSTGMARGGKEIALVCLGSDDPAAVRSIFHVLETRSTSIPAHKTGSMWTLDLATWNAHMYAQQRRAFRTEEHEALVRLVVVFTMLEPALHAFDRHLSASPEKYVEITPVLAEAIRTIERLLHGRHG